MIDISVVIIAKNAQEHLEKCLDSVREFSEVILYLNDCTDKTKEIAQGFSNVQIIDGYFDGFGSTKNRATTFTKNTWVFTLDSDEVVSYELLDELKKTTLSDQKIYRFHRLNHYKDKALDCCGWDKDFVFRLYNKNKTQYFNKKVHENLDLKNLETFTFKNSIYHYPFKSVSELIKKADYYSELFAQNSSKKSSIFKVIVHSKFMFFKSYILKKGFLYGYEGFLISFFNSFGSALKYIKLMDKNEV